MLHNIAVDLHFLKSKNKKIVGDVNRGNAYVTNTVRIQGHNKDLEPKEAGLSCSQTTTMKMDDLGMRPEAAIVIVRLCVVRVHVCCVIIALSYG